MNDVEKLIALIKSASANIERADISVDGLDGEFEDLGRAVCDCLLQVQELCRFVGDMADGKMDGPVPSKKNTLVGSSKDLFYKLKHLTWQAQQVAKGDYSQRVDFLGSFSDAFNMMIVDLDEREKQIRRHADEKLREAERKNAQLSRRMEQQIAHYRAYRSYTGSYNAFRERYKKMMGEVYDCFQREEYELGRLLVDRINDEMGANIDVHKEYSNHEFVNAGLIDIADICREKKIEFYALVYIPVSFTIEPRVAASLITTMTEYVLSMLAAKSDGQSLSITSSIKRNWLSITVTWNPKSPDCGDEDSQQAYDHKLWTEEMAKLAEEKGIMFDISADADSGNIVSVLHICMQK